MATISLILEKVSKIVSKISLQEVVIIKVPVATRLTRQGHPLVTKLTHQGRHLVAGLDHVQRHHPAQITTVPKEATFRTSIRTEALTTTITARSTTTGAITTTTIVAVTSKVAITTTEDGRKGLGLRAEASMATTFLRATAPSSLSPRATFTIRTIPST